MVLSVQHRKFVKLMIIEIPFASAMPNAVKNSNQYAVVMAKLILTNVYFALKHVEVQKV